MGSIEHDLRTFDAQQSRAEDIYEAHAPSVIERIVDDALEGKVTPRGCPSVVGMIIDGELDAIDLTLAIIGGGHLAEDAKRRLLKTVAAKVVEWCEGDGAAYVMEKCREEVA